MQVIVLNKPVVEEMIFEEEIAVEADGEGVKEKITVLQRGLATKFFFFIKFLMEKVSVK